LRSGTGTLKRRLQLMRGMRDIGQAALGAQSPRALVDEALSVLAETVACSSVTILVARVGFAEQFDAVLLDAASLQRHHTRQSVFPADISALLDAPLGILAAVDARDRSYVCRIEGRATRTATFALPLTHDAQLVGAVVLEFLPLAPTPEVLDEARQLAATIALAMGNVRLLAQLASQHRRSVTVKAAVADNAVLRR
jgi:transcriptional regulator with GAF, ATPase, and Fis domain